jgi:hypothetical protein
VAAQLFCLPLLSAAAEMESAVNQSTPIGRYGAISIAPGDKVHFVLVNSVLEKGTPLLDKVSPATRIENPNRDNAVISAAYEIKDTGEKTLRIRNGYAHALMFSYGGSCFSINPNLGYAFVKPGSEVTLEFFRDWNGTAPLCGFLLIDNRTAIHSGAQVVANQAAHNSECAASTFRPTRVRTEDRGEEIVVYFRVINPQNKELQTELAFTYNPSTGKLIDPRCAGDPVGY